MPRPGKRSFEKPKNFKGAIKRLTKELTKFKFLIIVSLILAALGSVLSIMAPNKLSKLTDEISKGLVIKNENLSTLMTNVSYNISTDRMNEVLTKKVESNISDDEKKKIMQFINNTKENPNNMISNINELPESVKQELFPEMTLDGEKITYDDQILLLDKMSKLTNKEDVNALYKTIDDLPKSIQTVVKPYMNIDNIIKIVLFLVALYVLSALFTYIESISMTTVSNKFAYLLRNKISLKINKLPLKYFDKNTSGDILSRVTNDVDTIAQTMHNSLSTLVSALTLFLGALIMMFYTNWIMAITAIVASFLGFIFMFIILGKSQKYFVARQQELGNLNGHIEEVYSGLNVVKVYNGQDLANEKFDVYNQKVYEANRKSQFLSGLMPPMMNFIGNLGYVAVCIVGALLTMNNQISFGVIVAFITYVRLFTSPLSQIGQAMNALQSTAAASERVFEFVDEEEMTDESNITNYLEKNKVEGRIEFRNVTFTYDGNNKPTITNFTAIAKPGQKIAIVGPTGAGKTTMVNLLMKFYDINEGEILIDGVPVSKLTRENIHSLFTMVLQDTWLFNGTIKENIIYNMENVDDEKIKEICEIVGLDHFIKTLPNGINSSLNDSDSVSSGQRQLLTIARGMMEDTPFIILDEATSNVDTRTEELVQKAMDRLTHDRTSFIIAHRLSTIKNADLILVMKDGNIIEQGTHKDLLKKNGFYAELYNSQFEL